MLANRRQPEQFLQCPAHPEVLLNDHGLDARELRCLLKQLDALLLRKLKDSIHFQFVLLPSTICPASGRIHADNLGASAAKSFFVSASKFFLSRATCREMSGLSFK
jgi:hypothetical protein